MKASSIVSFINDGSYHVDCQLSQLREQIKRWQEEENLDLYPDFQRGHVWNLNQQVAFVEYLLKGGKTSEFLFNTKGYFTQNSEDFICVDGLQRLTAIVSFLDNNLPVFGGHTYSDIQGIDALLKRTYVSLRINNLMTRREVLQWYVELNSGGTPHTVDEIDRVRALIAKEQ